VGVDADHRIDRRIVLARTVPSGSLAGELLNHQLECRHRWLDRRDKANRPPTFSQPDRQGSFTSPIARRASTVTDAGEASDMSINTGAL
jgi:hypothetical protein